MYRLFLCLFIFHHMSGQMNVVLPHVPVQLDPDVVKGKNDSPPTPRYIDNSKNMGKNRRLLIKLNEIEKALSDSYFDEDTIMYLFITLYALTRSMTSLSDVMHTRIQAAERLFDKKKKDAHKCSDCVLM